MALVNARASWALALGLLFAGIQANSNDPNAILCGQYDSFSTVYSPYIFSSNAWGDDGSGEQCINIDPHATVFNVTWMWKNNASSVHSFPNININSDILPLRLDNLENLNITTSWSMEPTVTKKGAKLSSLHTEADVVIDMFLDTDIDNAASKTNAAFEVMVWIGSFGGRTPIGWDTTFIDPPTQNLSSTSFKLYSGSNGIGQYVYSWLSTGNVTDFNEDISPLLHFLSDYKIIPSDNYLGSVQFGSETFHSTANITFSTSNFNFSVSQGTPLSLAPGSSSIGSNATSNSTGSGKKNDAASYSSSGKVIFTSFLVCGVVTSMLMI